MITAPGPGDPARHFFSVARAGFLVVFALLVFHTAWLCDDAYISFRTVRNFTEGEGLRWNLVERVQTFTHPLWLFVLSGAYAITRDVYFTSLALCFLFSMAAAIRLGWRVAPSAATGGLAIALLAGSRSYVDYSTSGLENALSHLLLVLLIERLVRRDRPDRLLGAAFLAGLSAVNRLDSLLVTVPILAGIWLRAPSWRRLGQIGLGFTPLVAWELFSLVYYGFPFPNTAYAKLPSGLARAGLTARGLHFLYVSSQWDRLLAAVLVFGVVAPLRQGARHLWPLSAGIVLQIAYVIWAGGDFMAGRFLTVPYVLAVSALVAGWPWLPRRWMYAAAALVITLYAAGGPKASLGTTPEYGRHGPGNWPAEGPRWVADERGVYYKDTGLLRPLRPFALPTSRRFMSGSTHEPGEVASTIAVGFAGWVAPRDVTFVDVLGIADPLLARLPPKDPSGFRPGHLDRNLPKGYMDSRRTGRNQIADKKVARLYDRVALVTQAPIFSRDRWQAIWMLNTGRGMD